MMMADIHESWRTICSVFTSLLSGPKCVRFCRESSASNRAACSRQYREGSVSEGFSMRMMMETARKCGGGVAKRISAAIGLLLLSAAGLPVYAAEEAGGEASLKLPDLSSVSFLGMSGHRLLLYGIVVCIFGLLFGMTIFTRLKNMPVHKSMRDISELIYETCKTYLVTQGKFLLILWAFIGAVIIIYFGVLLHFET